LDEQDSALIQERLAPVIAKHGIGSVLVAIADRLTADASELQKRGPGAKHMAVDLECLAGCIRDGLERYGPDG